MLIFCEDLVLSLIHEPCGIIIIIIIGSSKNEVKTFDFLIVCGMQKKIRETIGLSASFLRDASREREREEVAVAVVSLL